MGISVAEKGLRGFNAGPDFTRHNFNATGSTLRWFEDSKF